MNISAAVVIASNQPQPQSILQTSAKLDKQFMQLELCRS
jgi:hypothetical protein